MPYSIPHNQRVQLRRDTSANWTSGNPVLKSGEIGYETDTGQLKIGDNVTYWTSLAYFASDDIINLGADTNGSYVSAIVAGTGITLTNNSGEGSTPTVAVDTTAIQAKVSGVTDTEISYLDGVTSAIQAQLSDKAPLASPTFTGTVTLPSETVASADLHWSYYNSEAGLPSASANHGMFAHVHGTGAAYYAHGGSWYKLANRTDLDLKAPLDSPTLTGNPIAPTQSAGDNTTKIATTAFVVNAVTTGIASINVETDAFSDQFFIGTQVWS